MAAGVSTEPVTVGAGLVLTRLLDVTTKADEGAYVLRVQRARVLYRYNDSAGGVCIPPHFVAVDSHQPVMKFVRTVVHQRDIADNDASSTIDIDAPKGFDCKGGKPIAVECRVHPVLLRDKQNAIA